MAWARFLTAPLVDPTRFSRLSMVSLRVCSSSSWNRVWSLGGWGSARILSSPATYWRVMGVPPPWLRLIMASLSWAGDMMAMRTSSSLCTRFLPFSELRLAVWTSRRMWVLFSLGVSNRGSPGEWPRYRVMVP